MSWYNPLTWGGEAAEYLAEEAVDALKAAARGAKDRVIEDPKIVLLPGAVVLAGITTYHAAKAAGVEAGKQLTKDYFENLKTEG